MQHLDEGTIHAWLDGALAGDEAASVAKHVAECRECAAMVAEARGMIAAAANIVSALDGVRGGVVPASTGAVAGQRSLWRRLRFTPARAALAATLLIAVASLLTIRRAPPPHADEPDGARMPALPGVGGASVPAPEAAAAVSRQSEPARRKLEDAASARRPAASIATQAADAGTGIAKPAMGALSQMQPRSIANAPRPSMDTIATASADRAAAGVAGAPRRVENATQLREVTVTGASPSAKSFAQFSGVEGCYQLRADSAGSAAFAGFPARFALVNASGGAPYVVRSVSPEGRIDSIVPGGSWRRLTPELVRVSFANAVERHSLTLQFAAGVLTGLANVENQIGNLPVTRIDCRP